MTDASDPGLTDLIAAEIAKHQLDFGAMWHDDIRACTCGERVEEGYHSPHVASHVALVVEQHTNGRIAETVKSTGQRMYAQTKKWQERAENAEATIASLLAELEELKNG